MAGVGMLGPKIMGGVALLIAAVIGFNLMGPLYNQTNDYASIYKVHAENSSGVRATALYTKATDGELTKAADLKEFTTAGQVAPSAALTANTPYYSENDVLFITPSAAVSANATLGATTPTWKEPLGVVKRFSIISLLILAVLPIVGIGGFLGFSATNMFMGSGVTNVKDIGSAVLLPVISLVVAIIAMNFGPVAIDAADSVHKLFNSGRLSSLSLLSTIVVLILELVPVVWNASTIGLFVYQGVSAYRQYRGRRALPGTRAVLSPARG